ncbi:EAL domain-containing protein [Permianibacter sp. IMCC34836]|uniref:putative bifunctional diguanylate cyclase/phosphodiesterase n=1 Tax=Permianibacter fluminis TaxID=2738515 RepID=UPI001553F9B8|nr:EAL domain-containing protein [Permianibacter fluminis]NQD37253.1 EAL domain-containing protein [Permianibacter fluminis]
MFVQSSERGLLTGLLLSLVLAALLPWLPIPVSLLVLRIISAGLLLLAMVLLWLLLRSLKQRHSQRRFVEDWNRGPDVASAALLADIKGQVLAQRVTVSHLLDISSEQLSTTPLDRSVFATTPTAWPELKQRCLEGRSWQGLIEADGRRLSIFAYPVATEASGFGQLLVLEFSESQGVAPDTAAALLARLPVGMLVLRGRRVVQVNDSFCLLLGATRERVENKTTAEVFGAASPFEQALLQTLPKLMQNAQVETAVELQRHDGRSFWCELVFSALEPGQPQAGLLVLLADASEAKRREESLRQAAVVFDAASDIILVLDAERRIRMANGAFARITGYVTNDVMAKPPRLLFSSKQPAELYEHIFAQVQKQNVWQGEIWCRKKDGTVYPQWTSINAVRNDAGHIVEYVLIASDITERKRAEERLNYQANYDALTELPNRTLFVDRLRQSMSRARREGTNLALLFIDLDRFKNINDSMGHSAGDKLLVSVADALRSCVRESDTIARFGGDEFAVILSPIYGAKNAGTVAQTLLKVLSRPINIDGYDCLVGGSIGISIFPGDGDTPEDLIRNSDAAMYRAKDSGRNTYEFFTAEMQQQALARIGMERDLRYAIERQEFVLNFQPQLGLATGDVIGMEVLVRWESGTRGLVSPGDFISLAEENGQILALGEWVLKEACRQYVIWHREGIAPSYIAVNVSGRQFRTSQFPKLVQSILEETQMPATGLELELTESFLMEDEEHVMRTLGELRAMSVKLSIDDFGTGYSSLSYLKRFPISTLKIDQSFVRDIPGDDEDVAIVSAIIRMAHALKLDVVAEGVETAEQQRFLHELGCHIIQGFHYSRPLSVAQCSEFLREQFERRQAIATVERA